MAIKANREQPVSLVQLYVLQKNYLLGWICKLLFGVKYVISEQSTAYVDGSFEQFDAFKKTMYKWVFKGAAAFHTVSTYLAGAIRNKLHLTNANVVIPNVVDSTLFYYKNKQANDVVTFVHVSNMFFQKNIAGMLQALRLVKDRSLNYVLNLVGPLPDNVEKLIHELQLQDQINVWGANYEEVAAIIQQSDVFIFFTRFETFGCVIIEANACGLPVIVTDLEVTRELIEDHRNGWLVENENIQDLANRIIIAIKEQSLFDRQKISTDTRQRFNYETVGAQFLKWFQAQAK